MSLHEQMPNLQTPSYILTRWTRHLLSEGRLWGSPLAAQCGGAMPGACVNSWSRMTVPAAWLPKEKARNEKVRNGADLVNILLELYFCTG